MSVYIENETSINNYKNIIYIGISVIDLSTGKNTIFETYSKDDDENYALDELYRCIKIYNPAEITFTYEQLPLGQ